ncbi:SGNH/GDSL hydrolase family protein [Bosea thiooxidans]
MSGLSFAGGTGILVPRAAAPLIAFAGDSITAMAPYSTASVIANHPYAPSSWLIPMLGQRARTEHGLNFGVAGDTSTMLLARIGEIAACPADIVCVLIGTNDVNGAVSAATFATYKANLIAIVDRLLNAGKLVIVTPPLPRNLAAGSQNNRRLLHAMREWTLRLQWSGRRNLRVADAALEYGDPLSDNYAPRAGYDYDGLHPQSRGAYEIAKALHRVLDRLLPPVPQGLVSADDVYDATYNPDGNLLINGILDGTGGTITGAQGLTTTGSQMATGWKLTFNAPYSGATALNGLAVVASKNTTEEGLPEQVFTISGAYTGDVDSSFGMSQAVGSLSRLSVGDVIECTGEVVLDPSAAELPLVSPRLGLAISYPVAGSYRTTDMHWVANGYAPKEGYKLLLRTPRITLPEVPSAMTFGVGFCPRQAANTLPNNAVFRIRRLALRKVIS